MISARSVLKTLVVLSVGLGLGTSAAAGTVTLEPTALETIGPGHYRVRPEALIPPPAEPSAPAATLPSSGSTLLTGRIARGEASGFTGLLYDNRDRGHSDLALDLFPGLVHVAYDKTLMQAGLDYGLAGALVFPQPVIGNSSTAVTGGAAPRSLPRLAMTMPGGPAAAFRTYAANALYVYPEHRDHDARDLFPANWPYMVISQGSSHSDRPFLQALLQTLAAFPPETRARLEEAGLVAPTLQMILRRSLRPVTSEAAYLSGLAHPVVFAASDLVPGRMMAIAAAMAPDTIPPMVRLSVPEEDFQDSGERSERLYDTLAAVARVWRVPGGEKHLTLSAARTFDPNGQPLQFHWALLTGDPARVEIAPFGADDAHARIRLGWQDPTEGALPGRPPGTRIDIGVFASNGAWTSAPAIFSVVLPLHEERPELPFDPAVFPDTP